MVGSWFRCISYRTGPFSGDMLLVFWGVVDPNFPKNLQQDLLNGPYTLVSNNSSNLVRGPLGRSHSLFDGNFRGVFSCKRISLVLFRQTPRAPPQRLDLLRTFSPSNFEGSCWTYFFGGGSKKRAKKPTKTSNGYITNGL